MAELIFLKLGGSLITDKSEPYVARLDKLAELAQEVASFLKGSHAASQLLLGHGSGSFGHVAGEQHGTRQGVNSPDGWRGFAEVQFQAAALNRHVMKALHEAGIPALSLPPSASVIASDGRVLDWQTAPIRRALANGILPVIYGDVVFDNVRGGTILSTEDLFRHLTLELGPSRILLAGLENGVWADFPARTRILEHISPSTYTSVRAGVGKAVGADVTGGMQAKVQEMLELIQMVPGLEVTIFSGQEPGNLLGALKGDRLGTRIGL
jgi:isopentenyl phosphate kinase